MLDFFVLGVLPIPITVGSELSTISFFLTIARTKVTFTEALALSGAEVS